MSNGMKFVTDLSKGILGTADSSELWEEIIAHIPDSVLLKPGVKILNVACGHGTEADVLVRRMVALGVPKEQINDSIYLLDKYTVFTNRAKRKGYKNVRTVDFLAWETDMKFDVVIGNPPYQDGKKKGQQNKIYNQMSKKAISLLAADGIMAFITPTSVCKKSKRFSIIDNPKLVHVDFTADNHFVVGINICYWILDNSKDSINCIVKSKSGDIKNFGRGEVIYDHGVYDELVMSIKTKIKDHSSLPDQRMFLRNNPGPTKSVTKTSEFVYPLYDISEDSVSCYVKRVPYNHGKTKIALSMTKSLNKAAAIISDKDFNDSVVSCEVESDEQTKNIKSFIFSEYFINLTAQWKLIDGYGFNEAIKYLPRFDKNKRWSNDDVKMFIESYVK